MTNNHRSALTATLALAFAVSSHATTIYTTQSAWLSALNGASLTTLNFTGTVPKNGVAGSDGDTYGAGVNGAWTASLVNTGVTFASDGSVFYVSKANPTDGSFHTSEYLDWQGNSDLGTLTVTFPTAESAFGFNIGSYNSGGGTVTIDVNGTDYSKTMPSGAYGFFGFTSTSPITSFEIIDGSNYATLDNLQFANTTQAAIPDAASTALLLMAACGCLALARTRSRRLQVALTR